jgi:uncharacterized protein YqhQ
MFKSGFLARVLLAPGLWTQYLTTREPTDDQIEVAVAALQKVRELEEGVPTAASHRASLARIGVIAYASLRRLPDSKQAR